ncbi:hypothetical protein Q1695_008199 [Nippostrongylus brasiliensis]|nr:hypothetical protein Q1695_008199 [Nippostrongylus brasiliensis]
MSTISVCKANITKAVRALEVAKRKIPEYLLDHSDVQVDHLEELKDTIHAHIAELRQAVRTVKERQQSFIAVVSNSSNLEADSEEYVNYIENMKIEDTLVRTETVISALRRQMEEVLSLLTDQSQDKLGEITADQPPICGGDELVQVLGTANAAGPGKTKERQPFESQASYPPRIQAASQSIGAIPRQQAISPIQLGKLKLEPIEGDITQFRRFWSTFELAVDSDPTISTVYKFLYLRSLLKGEAQIVLQDLDPDECNYHELVDTLKKRYDRPHRTRAVLHRQLQQLPPTGPSASDLRNT